MEEIKMPSSDLSDWESENDAPTFQRPVFKSVESEMEWERKQRNREYRVAARREKRTRKADEKKQRKLNATILRRMTKNPEKYNKNVNRNRRRDIELERRKIWKEAVLQVERLAAVHDPSGKMFNIGPVIVQEDGKVVSLETMERRARARVERDGKLAYGKDVDVEEITNTENGELSQSKVKDRPLGCTQDNVDPARRNLIQTITGGGAYTKKLSKNQQKKLAILTPRPPPPKPLIPPEISISEGEENWLALWDLSDDELERRVIKEKKRKATERRALREKQKEGKAERRAARDERRKVYREKKVEWKAIKEAEKVQKRKVLRVEQEEAKKIEIEVNFAERQRAMQICAKLGFTLNNVEGVQDIKPKALGMKGKEIDFDVIEIGARPSELKVRGENFAKQQSSGMLKKSRVDLGRVANESMTKAIISDETGPISMEGDFVSLDFDSGAVDGQEFEALNYNHKLRRKLHRAIEAAQIQKELLVRARAKEHCEKNNIPVPPELAAEYKPIKLSGRRMLEDGSMETEKQERVRKRLELAQYNKAAKVLRQQAKAEAIEAGLRLFAQLTGKKTTDAQKVPERFFLDGNTNRTERQSQSVSSTSKKRQSHDDEIDTRFAKKAKNISTSSRFPLTTQPIDSENEDQEHKKKNRDKVTLPLTGLEARIVNKPKEAKNKTKKRNASGELGQRVLSSGDSDVASKRKKQPIEEFERQENLTGNILEGNLDPEVVSNLNSKKSKKANHNKDGTSAVSSHLEKNEKTTKQYSNKGKGFEAEIEDSPKSGESWNVDALKGDAARKEKFLRLLGAGKSSSVEKPAQKIKTKDVDMIQVEDELERQFEAGIRMKNNGQTKRRGLGA